MTTSTRSWSDDGGPPGVEDVARWRRDWATMMRHYQPGRDDLLAAGLAAAEQAMP